MPRFLCPETSGYPGLFYVVFDQERESEQKLSLCVFQVHSGQPYDFLSPVRQRIPVQKQSCGREILVEPVVHIGFQRIIQLAAVGGVVFPEDRQRGMAEKSDLLLARCLIDQVIDRQIPVFMEISRQIQSCRQLYIKWINNKVLLYNTGNYSQTLGLLIPASRCSWAHSSASWLLVSAGSSGISVFRPNSPTTAFR